MVDPTGVLPGLAGGVTSPVWVGYALLLVLVGVILLGVAYWVWTTERSRAASAFIVALVASAIWSAGIGVQILVPSYGAKVLIYQLWVTASWPVGVFWFVFVVYYTGRDHWLTPRRLGAVVVFVAVVMGLALTNHLHWLLWSDYTLVTDQYRYPVLAAERTGLYWAFLTVVYGLALVGLFLLFKLLVTARHASAAQAVALLSGSGAVFAVNVLYHLVATQNLPELNPSPAGLGVLFVLTAWALFRHQLFAIDPLARDTIMEEIEEGVVIVDGRDRLIDYNAAACQFLPGLDGAIGDQLAMCCPSLATEAGAEGLYADALTVELEGDVRRLSVSVSPLHVADRIRGRALILEDVTELERYASELERQNERLERFASTVSHDLRNPLTVADGYLELIEQTGETDDVPKVRNALDRMEQLIDDLLTLAREGQAIEEREAVFLAAVSRAAWETAETGSLVLTLEVDDDVAISADETRLRTLLENLFRNVADHAEGATTVRVGLLDAVGEAGDPDGPERQSGFYVADDGSGIPEADREPLFEYGYSSAEAGTGLGLATVGTIAEAHGWTVSVEESAEGGARVAVRDVTVLRDQPTS